MTNEEFYRDPENWIIGWRGCIANALDSIDGLIAGADKLAQLNEDFFKSNHRALFKERLGNAAYELRAAVGSLNIFLKEQKKQ